MKCENCGAKNKNKSTFCGVCGQRLIKKKKNNNIYKYFIIMLLIILIIAIIIIGITSLNNKKVFFSDELESENSEQILVENENSNFVKKENKASNTKSSSYTTSIIYDNEYEGTVNSVEEVKKQIVADSVSQKKNTTSEEIQKIENRIISNYGITAVNFGEMDIETALGIEEVIKYIYEKYPKARTYLSNISLGNMKLSQGNIIAFFGPQTFITPSDYSGYPEGNKTLVCLSSKYFLNINLLNKSIEDSCKAGHFPQNASTYSSVIHELGHYLTFVLTMKKYGIDNYLYIDETNIKNEQLFIKDWNNGDLALDIIKEAYSNYQRDYNDTTLSFDDFRATISGYAVVKDGYGDYIYHETIAEAFNDYYCNKENSAKASIEIMKVFNQRMEEL